MDFARNQHAFYKEKCETLKGVAIRHPQGPTSIDKSPTIAASTVL